MALKKSEKKMLIILGVVAVIAAIVFYRIYGPDNSEPEIISESTLEEEVEKKETTNTSRPSSSGSSSRGSSRSSSSSSSSTSETVKTVSMDEFQKHSRGDDCWVLIEGDVYNITFFIEKYPSQREKGITEYCGTVGFEAGYLKENNIRESVKENASNLGKIG